MFERYVAGAGELGWDDTNPANYLLGTGSSKKLQTHQVYSSSHAAMGSSSLLVRVCVFLDLTKSCVAEHNLELHGLFADGAVFVS